jgi:hypothetical protein
MRLLLLAFAVIAIAVLSGCGGTQHHHPRLLYGLSGDVHAKYGLPPQQRRYATFVTAPKIVARSAAAPYVSEVLTTTDGTWTVSGVPNTCGANGMTCTYQWQHCTPSVVCSNIAAAITNTYTITSADVGDTIQATVTATNSAGSASQTSARTGTVPYSGFVTASGGTLQLNGAPIQFIGYNAYGMEGCWNGSGGSAWTTAQLDAYFASLPSNGLTRFWATQAYGTTALGNILTEAAKYHQHVIPVLGNDDGQCDPTTDDTGQSGEPVAFYQTNWSTQYVAWVNTVVPMFASDTSIAMWEVANEPGQYAHVTEATMAAYMNGAAHAIKNDDSNHLVSSGFNDAQNSDATSDGGSGNGTQSTFTAVHNSPYIDVVEAHDYAWDYESGATYSQNFTTAQTAARALNKPFIIGEAGVEACASPSGNYSQNGLPWKSYSQRVTYLTTKAHGYFAGTGPAGTNTPTAAGVLFWVYEPLGAGQCSGYQYDITAASSDPMIAAVTSFTTP